MAITLPVCPKCENTFFVLQEYKPVNQAGAQRKIEILLCNLCGAVVTTTGLLSILEMITETSVMVQKIAHKLDV